MKLLNFFVRLAIGCVLVAAALFLNLSESIQTSGTVGIFIAVPLPFFLLPWLVSRRFWIVVRGGNSKLSTFVSRLTLGILATYMAFSVICIVAETGAKGNVIAAFINEIVLSAMVLAFFSPWIICFFLPSSIQSSDVTMNVRNSNEWEAHFITTSTLDSTTLRPIELTGFEPLSSRQALARVVEQLEKSLASLIAPPKIKGIKVKSAVSQTLQFQDVEAATQREFYSLGLQYQGEMGRVLGFLRFTDHGPRASVTLESKERLDSFLELSVWILSTFFAWPKGENQNAISICVWVGTFFLVFAALGAGAAYGVLVVLAILMAFSTMLRTYKKKEKDSLSLAVQLHLTQAYQQIDLSRMLTVAPVNRAPSPPLQQNAAPQSRSEEPSAQQPKVEDTARKTETNEFQWERE